MDQAISPEMKKRRKKKLIIKVVITVMASVGMFWFLVGVFQPKIRGAEVNFGTVDEGAVEVSVYATGKVVPFAEEIVTSPVSSKVLEVYKKSGDRVEKGEPLLQLDLETIRTDYETKKESLEMQLSKLDLQRKTIASDLAEMKMQIDIDEMMLKRTLVALNNERYLDSIGASTQEKVREAELNYTVKQMQQEQLKRKFENKQSASRSEIRSLELDYKIAKKNIDLLYKTLGEAQVLAPRSATLTWINDQVGSSVSQGSNLAILSDLSSFKVEGEIADSYADKITTGNRVNVVIGSEKLAGTVGNVTPSVNNGIIKFVVFLTEHSNTRLRSGLKVDVHVTHAMKDDVLRIPTGAYYMGKGDYDMWVVNGDRAEKRKVVLGESGFEHVEVVQGLTSGEKVILSDMGRYRDKEVLYIK
ncbi:efflux RND transporter periplasmic adaptor subunit [Butyricimonas hominis]|uniref:Efflux RND transporter periplasmic adaptor subunit n=1 Tax=Butyricimonas hominis TaxID=2763032 RepID=A0ABR7CXM9_9BACT|nr:efflux RND transporter periplasmic adaptor subunit [Butyricimonas hominis]MBC5620441.1 efflux RND transporter periplasmic adaptor subunit [Butyricimonas hominis]